jgi:hypothetical protein
MADTQYTKRREFTRSTFKTPGAAGLFPITIEKKMTFTHGGVIQKSAAWAKDFQKVLSKETTKETRTLVTNVVVSLIENSPEDTGLLKYSWFATAGKISREVATPKGKFLSPSSIEKFRKNAKAKPPGPQVVKSRVSKYIKRLKLGKGANKRINITNNVYYTAGYDDKFPFIAQAIDSGVDSYIRNKPSDIIDNEDVDWLF